MRCLNSMVVHRGPLYSISNVFLRICRLGIKVLKTEIVLSLKLFTVMRGYVSYLHRMSMLKYRIECAFVSHDHLNKF